VLPEHIPGAALRERMPVNDAMRAGIWENVHQPGQRGYGQAVGPVIGTSYPRAESLMPTAAASEKECWTLDHRRLGRGWQSMYIPDSKELCDTTRLCGNYAEDVGKSD